MKKYKKINEGILAEYDSKFADNAEFWTSHWGNSSVKTSIEKARKSIGGYKFILKYIDFDDKILEAGCGKGQVVAGFDQLNYDITGVDFAKKIINEIKEYDSKLKVHYGDLRKLKFEDNYFTTYLSFGVIEHFNKKKDVSDIINEAKRVTSNQLFFSVPYYSPKLKEIVDELKESKEKTDNFFQYYFDINQLENFFNNYNLKIKSVEYYATYIGLKRHSKIFKALNNIYIFRLFLSRMKHILNYIFGKKYAHMIGVWVTK